MMPAESPFPSIAPRHDLPPRPLRWLFLDLNSYFASVEQQLQPSLRGRPVIVAPVGSDTTVAIAASVEAKRYGITTGTPVWEAKQRCPDLVVTRRGTGATSSFTMRSWRRSGATFR